VRYEPIENAENIRQAEEILDGKKYEKKSLASA